MSDSQSGSNLDTTFTELAARSRAAISAAAGFDIAPTRRVDDDGLDRAESLRSASFPPDLRAFYRAVGAGVFGWFEVLDPTDEHDYDQLFRRDLELYRSDGLFDDAFAEGDPPSVDGLVVATDETALWIYDLTPDRVGRIVTYNAGGKSGFRKSWTAAASLLDLIRCVTEIAETGALAPYSQDIQLAAAPEEFGHLRPILDRNNATAAIFYDANQN